MIKRKPYLPSGRKKTLKRGIGRIKRKLSSKAKIKPWKLTKSALAKVDAQFSKEIIKRDMHCQYPGCVNTKKLTCSHFIGRVVKSTRFDEDNCIALCLFHHFFSKDLGFEFQKQTKAKHGYDGQYTIFQKKRLGRARYAALIKRANTDVKLQAAILTYQQSLL